ncbi:hypothetical protein BM1374166_01748 [Bartonella tribocorum]|nr:hypothetical protein BM1374166_01748 [Bartonella tribocorum]
MGNASMLWIVMLWIVDIMDNIWISYRENVLLKYSLLKRSVILIKDV